MQVLNSAGGRRLVGRACRPYHTCTNDTAYMHFASTSGENVGRMGTSAARRENRIGSECRWAMHGTAGWERMASLVTLLLLLLHSPHAPTVAPSQGQLQRQRASHSDRILREWFGFLLMAGS